MNHCIQRDFSVGYCERRHNQNAFIILRAHDDGTDTLVMERSAGLSSLDVQEMNSQIPGKLQSNDPSHLALHTAGRGPSALSGSQNSTRVK